MKKVLVCTMMLLMGGVFVYPQPDSDKRKFKEERADRAYEATKQLINDGNFEFQADRLISSTGYSNSIVTTPNTIRIEGGQVKVVLPYFGELRANTPYLVDGGIKYEGEMEDYKLEFRDNKRMSVVRFGIDRGIEDHNFNLYIGKDGQTRVVVISSGRTSISYYGRTNSLDEASGF